MDMVASAARMRAAKLEKPALARAEARKAINKERILAILKQATEPGMSIIKLSRKLGISKYTLFWWRRKYLGLVIPVPNPRGPKFRCRKRPRRRVPSTRYNPDPEEVAALLAPHKRRPDGGDLRKRRGRKGSHIQRLSMLGLIDPRGESRRERREQRAGKYWDKQTRQWKPLPDSEPSPYSGERGHRGERTDG